MKKADILFQQFCEFYNEKNLAALLGLFSHNATLIGSVVDEIRIGLEEIKTQLERDFSQATAKMHIVRFLPAPDNALYSSAICEAVITKDEQSEHFDNLRGSIMIEKEDEDFKIVHMHASFPDSRSPVGYSFPKK